jgi:hypothetical protein
MKRLLALLTLALVLGACSRTATQVASPSPKSATEALGCDFKVPNAMTKDRTLTQASINEAVAAAPAAIRNDLRTIYESSKKYQDDIKAAQAAPQAERSRRLQEASKTLNNSSYKAAAQRLRTYFTQHCTGLQRGTPTPNP